MGDLLLESSLQRRGSEFVLAKEVELTAVFKAEEIGQAVFTDALGAGRARQDAVDMGEMCRVIPGAWRPPGCPTCRRANENRRRWSPRPRSGRVWLCVWRERGRRATAALRSATVRANRDLRTPQGNGGPERTLAADRYRTIVDVYVLLRRPDGMILLLERSGTGYADGQLCPPSGHLEAGESVVQGAIREAREENRRSDRPC